MQDVSIVAETITANSKLTVANGSVSLDGGLLSSNGSGSLSVAGLYGGVATASISVATASGTSIPVANRVVKVSASAVTTSGSCTLAVGTVDGQDVCLINESANNIIISGNMMGAVAATVAASAGQVFAWSATDTKWFPC